MRLLPASDDPVPSGIAEAGWGGEGGRLTDPDATAILPVLLLPVDEA